MCVHVCSAMDSFDSLLAIPPLLSDSQSSSSSTMSTSNIEAAAGAPEVSNNVNNEDDQLDDVGSDEDDDKDDDEENEEALIYAEDLVAINSTDGSPGATSRYSNSGEGTSAAVHSLGKIWENMHI